MLNRSAGVFLSFTILSLGVVMQADAQSFKVLCPTTTVTHPNPSGNPLVNNQEPEYKGPTSLVACTPGKLIKGTGTTCPASGTFMVPANSVNPNGAIKCQQISGGDGYATMADGTQTYMFSFGPLSGVADLANGLPGTEFPSVFNQLTRASTRI